MDFITKLYTYCVSSILLFGIGLLAIASSYPANSSYLRASDTYGETYTAISVDYSNLHLEANLG